MQMNRTTSLKTSSRYWSNNFLNGLLILLTGVICLNFMYSGINEDSIENACTSLNTIIYVDQSFSSSGDGSSWNYPYKLLSQAVNAAASNPQCEAIYVAEGVYKTTNSQNPDVSFVLGDVNIYGGFPAGGSSFTERDWHKY